MRPPLRRFWQHARAVPGETGFGVELDAQALRTPAGAALTVPTAALASAIAAEWEALGERVDPAALPLTRAVNSAIDRVAAAAPAVAAAIAAYAEADVVCYRAEEPPALRARQAAAWDPMLAFAASLGAPLQAVDGLMPHPQPPRSLATLRREVAARDAFALTGLHDLVSLTGSVVLGLAVAAGKIDGADAFERSRIDEVWQAERWGRDAEAEAAAQARRTAMMEAARLLALLVPLR